MMKKHPGKKLRYFQYSIVAVVLWFGGVVRSNAQEITNRLQGYFKATSDTTLYSHFTFDGNGKVDIGGLGDGYYFQKGDSLILYPDKSMFKFLLNGDQLQGVSEWVDGGVWTLAKDTVIENKRTDPEAADRVAGLMNRYYEVTSKNKMALLGATDDGFAGEIKNLCDSGLSKACLDYAGLKIIENMGGLGALLGGKELLLNKDADPEVLALIEKALQLGDMEGYAVLGGYYSALQNQGKAKDVLEKGSELGCRRCVWAAFSLALEEEAQKAASNEKKAAPQKAVKGKR
ncbi:hypothetical protein LQ567_10590 [Niabella pedocola]|uniref:Sel1 repeat family protein n=1 Tax=Niabella pedocola TaxID=1752077 RepID=A0ABS8PQ38_9BACT|nr:hypothetical protein [Niabella pedocola]MCD2423208.1 hypothetical protein [Niabella pedocola]